MLDLGPSERFDFDILKAIAAAKAKAPYAAPPTPDPAVLKRINYDTYNAITYDIDKALYRDGTGPYPITFLPVGELFGKSVAMYVVEGEAAREILFRPDYFRHPPGSPIEDLKAHPSPFAGFEVRHDWNAVDLRAHEGWARFVGASYFRAVGEADQFGLSARGVAQNPGGGPPEEFPDFTHFWVSEGKTPRDPVSVHALLDGPSITGAYRFLMFRDRTTRMDITCQLHIRKPIVRLGIAPLTSMFWFSETVSGAAVDWRPEVHDSDGLAMWTGCDEHVWRPLTSPSATTISTFQDENPRGFGLMQRDKAYDHYLDVVKYECRPCGWVEPIGLWGKGSVQLVENPTDNEIYDNVIAMWVPAEPTVAGQTLDYRYNLHWSDEDLFAGRLARCVATRLGKGGVKGAPRSDVLRLFIVEFKGPNLTALKADQPPDAVLKTSAGRFLRVEVEPSPDRAKDMWRARFELDPDGADVADLSCVLRLDGKPLTETWRFHYVRFSSPVR